MRSWSTACSIRPATASTWPGSGSTPPATATPTACTWTTTARSGPIATGSSRRSTPTSRSTGSSSSSSPATCCPTRRLDQIVATGFNRCHVSTSEGGSIEEEVYVRNVVDQVDTNGTVFLGLTIGCARCHDHKYDPIRMKDYYQLFAFFNNIDGPALDGNAARWAPDRQGADGRADKAALEAADKKIAAIRQTIAAEAAEGRGGLRRQGRRRPGRVRPSGRISSGSTTPCPRGPRPRATAPGSSSPGPITRVSAARRRCESPPRGSSSGSSRTPGGSSRSARETPCSPTSIIDPLNPPKEIMLQWHTAGAWATGPTGART